MCARNRSKVPELAAVIHLRKNAIKPYIPRIWAYFLDFLAIESNTRKLRPKPLSFAAKKAKATVEIATAHSNSIQVFIEYDQRSHDDIESFWRNDSTGNRLPYAEFIFFQSRIALDSNESHFAFVFDHRNKNLFFSPPCSLEYHARIDFACERQVTRDRFAAEEKT